MTIARWYRPSGKPLDSRDGQELGIAPDIAVEITPEDMQVGRDAPLDRAIAYLTGGKQP